MSRAHCVELPWGSELAIASIRRGWTIASVPWSSRSRQPPRDPSATRAIASSVTRRTIWRYRAWPRRPGDEPRRRTGLRSSRGRGSLATVAEMVGSRPREQRSWRLSWRLLSHERTTALRLLDPTSQAISKRLCEWGCGGRRRVSGVASAIARPAAARAFKAKVARAVAPLQDSRATGSRRLCPEA